MYFIISILLLVISFIIAINFPKYKKIIIIIDIIVSIIYMGWRVTVIPIHNGILSFILGISLFSAELLGAISFFNFQYLFYKRYELKKMTLQNYGDQQIPKVDILVCTYNEPLDLLEKTIIATKEIDYPENKFEIYICDDGKREELKQMCLEYDVNYITRDGNEGAKAGNINNALRFIKGELFAVLDADMIPKKEFLRKTVGYFANKNMAFVQTPQVYYNQDMYQYNLNKHIPNEQDFFMRDIEEARASRNAVLHVGTNAVFRKKYIDNIGGYPTCSITEDMAVGMKLQSKGYDSVFVNEDLVLGLSATTFSELVKQRDRWCRGNLQVMKKFNPIFDRGLSFGQKIAYLDGVVYWLSSIQKMIYMLSPLIYLLTCKLIIDSSVEELLVMFIPFMVGQVLIFKVLSPQTRSLTWSHYYEVAMAPHISFSVLREIFSIKTKFNVTSKDIVTDKKQFQYKVALPHIIIGLMSIIAWIVSSIYLINGKIVISAYLINMAWSIYNFIAIVTVIQVAYQKPIYRKNERVLIKNSIEVKVKINNRLLNATLLDISEKGVGISIDEKNIINLNENIELILNNTNIECKVIRKENNKFGLIFINKDKKLIKEIMKIYVDNLQAYYHINKKQPA